MIDRRARAMAKARAIVNGEKPFKHPKINGPATDCDGPFQKAYTRAVGTKPYTRKLTELSVTCGHAGQPRTTACFA